MNKNEFMARVHRICPLSEAADVELAYNLAKKFHKGQLRKELGPDGKPLRYFEHLRRTALHLIDAGVSKYEIIICALLHDSVEDVEEIQLVSSLIERSFGKTVAQWIRLLSKTDKNTYLGKLREGAFAGPFPGFILVKAADRLDNLMSLPDDPSFKEKQYRETREDYIPLFKECIDRHTFSFADADAMNHLYKKIVELV